MQNMPNVWLDSLETFDQVVSHIEDCLDILKANSATANFMDVNDRKQFSNDVMFMKQFFEKAENLIRNDYENSPQ